MNNIRIYEKNERQYKVLKMFAEMVNDNLTSGYLTVENIYFDMGQNWIYTALITNKEDGVFGSWQSFCPRDYELRFYIQIVLQFLNKWQSIMQKNLTKEKSVFIFTKNSKEKGRNPLFNYIYLIFQYLILISLFHVKHYKY